MPKHLIVISQDAMVYEDLAYLQTLPAYAKIWSKCAFVNTLRSVYPTVTYPVHTSIRTGVYPDRHGVVNNEQTILHEVTSKWVHMNSAVKVPDLFDAAKAAGLSTAAVFWPVTGLHKSIDYLINEYWPQEEGETTLDCFVHSGSSPAVMEKVVSRHAHLVDGRNRQHPYIDLFINACACSIIREFKPNLLLIHPANIDAYRHQTGLFSPLVTHGLHEIDGWFRELVVACQDAGIYEDTDFCILSDHGQLNVRGILCPNVLLREAGLITVTDAGEVASYRAMGKSTALSMQIYLSDRNDRALHDHVYGLLCAWRDEGVYGIERVYTAEEAAREEHLAGDFSVVLESNGIYTFGNDWQRPLTRPLTSEDYRFGRATHGHHPDKGPQPCLFAFGPHIKAGAVVDRRPMVDTCPTFARLLGLEMDGIEGAAIEEILK